LKGGRGGSPQRLEGARRKAKGSKILAWANHELKGVKIDRDREKKAEKIE